MLRSAIPSKRVYKTIYVLALSSVVAVAFGQLTASQKSTFEKLQDTIQDDAVGEMYLRSGVTAELSWELPEVTKTSFTVIENGSMPMLRDKEDKPYSVRYKVNSKINWNLVKSITLDKRTVEIVLKKKVKTQVEWMEFRGTGTDITKKVREEQVWLIQFPKTAQARNASNLFNSLLKSFRK